MYTHTHTHTHYKFIRIFVMMLLYHHGSVLEYKNCDNSCGRSGGGVALCEHSLRPTRCWWLGDQKVSSQLIGMVWRRRRRKMYYNNNNNNKRVVNAWKFMFYIIIVIILFYVFNLSTATYYARRTMRCIYYYNYCSLDVRVYIGYGRFAW